MIDAGSAYREAAVRGANPLQIVVCLYDRLLADLRHGLDALARRDIGARTLAIDHAIEIVGCLQGALKFGAGGEVADKLGRFYNFLRQRLLQAQAEQSSAILEELLSRVMEVREAWNKVGQSPTTHPASSETGTGMEQNIHKPANGWRA